MRPQSLEYTATVSGGGEVITASGTVDDPTTIAGVSPHTMCWSGQAAGTWQSGAWSDTPPVCPNCLINAVVDTSAAITVGSTQVANSLELSNGGAVTVASGGSLSIAGDVTLGSSGSINVATGGVLALSGLIDSANPAAMNIDGGSLGPALLCLRGADHVRRQRGHH